MKHLRSQLPAEIPANQLTGRLLLAALLLLLVCPASTALAAGEPVSLSFFHFGSLRAAFFL